MFLSSESSLMLKGLIIYKIATNWSLPPGSPSANLALHGLLVSSQTQVWTHRFLAGTSSVVPSAADGLEPVPQAWEDAVTLLCLFSPVVTPWSSMPCLALGNDPYDVRTFMTPTSPSLSQWNAPPCSQSDSSNSIVLALFSLKPSSGYHFTLLLNICISF